MEILIEWYLWLKAFHIIFVISWMAGLFYLPRLFVYHTRVENGSSQDELFQVMELKLQKIIMNPAMILTFITGFILIMISGMSEGSNLWLPIKILAVFVMAGFHMYLAGCRKRFQNGSNLKSENFYRKINEVPTILMIGIVILVVVKPF